MRTPIVMAASRTVAVPLDETFRAVLPMPLPLIFHRWFGPLPAIKEVVGQDGEWSTVGQTRTIVTADRGRMRETLTAVDAPTRFTYHLDPLGGPLKGLLAGVDGEWQFTPAGAGTEITWQWTLQPRNRVAGAIAAGIPPLWRAYAKRALAEVERQLPVV